MIICSEAISSQCAQLAWFGIDHKWHADLFKNSRLLMDGVTCVASNIVQAPQLLLQ
jgi:hypothetical protein